MYTLYVAASCLNAHFPFIVSVDVVVFCRQKNPNFVARSRYTVAHVYLLFVSRPVICAIKPEVGNIEMSTTSSGLRIFFVEARSAFGALSLHFLFVALAYMHAAQVGALKFAYVQGRSPCQAIGLSRSLCNRGSFVLVIILPGFHSSELSVFHMRMF